MSTPDPHEPPGDDSVQWLSDDELAAWMSTVALMFRLPGALDAQLQRDAGLTFFEYSVLAVLSQQPDRTLQMLHIAQASSSSQSRLSHTMARLEKQGLVVRTRIPGAGRRTNASLTDAGMAKVREAAPAHVAQVRALLIDHLSTDELRALRRAGEQVSGCIDPTSEAAPSDPKV